MMVCNQSVAFRKMWKVVKLWSKNAEMCKIALEKNAETRQSGPEEQLEKLKKVLQDADAVIIGAGAGLSTSAGFIYNGELFRKYLMILHQY